MKKIKNLKMIVCVGENNLIGSRQTEGNGLLWHIKEELLYFKEKTLGHTLLFGANTSKCVPLESMKKNREVIVLRSSTNLDELLSELEKQNKTIFVCGGYTIYKLFLENYEFEEIYLSEIKQHVDVKKTDTPLYLPDVEDYGYSLYSVHEFKDFFGYVYKKMEKK